LLALTFPIPTDVISECGQSMRFFHRVNTYLFNSLIINTSENTIKVLKAWLHNLASTMVEAVGSTTIIEAIDHDRFNIFSIHHNCFNIGSQPKNLRNVEGVNGDIEEELIEMVHKRSVLFFIIVKNHQWDPGGLLDLDMLPIVRFSQFMQWDPGKFSIEAKFYNLMDKVDLEGVGNDMILKIRSDYGLLLGIVSFRIN
jgi:hypothetical protein